MYPHPAPKDNIVSMEIPFPQTLVHVVPLSVDRRSVPIIPPTRIVLSSVVIIHVTGTPTRLGICCHWDNVGQVGSKKRKNNRESIRIFIHTPLRKSGTTVLRKSTAAKVVHPSTPQASDEEKVLTGE